MNDLSRLILGTVQFGLRYGISNNSGKTSLVEVSEMLSFAKNAGIRFLDTADGYGDSPDVLAKVGTAGFEILSKFTLDDPKVDRIDAKIHRSLDRLKTSKLWSYSFHRFSDYLSFVEWDGLLAAKQKNVISNVGVSLYTNDEFYKAIIDPKIDVIQIPFNVLDNWKERGDLISAANANGKIVHVRSVFLQGLFQMDPMLIPPHLEGLVSALQEVHYIAKKHEMSVGQVCLGYVRCFQHIQGVVLGQENLSQLKENISLFNTRLNPQIVEDINRIRVDHTELLNPVNWKK